MALSSSFVSTNRTSFELEGAPLRLSGANNYYLAYAPDSMVKAVFQLAREMKMNVLRTWAFIDSGPATPGAVPENTPYGVFFHYWNSVIGRPDFNDGPNGLEHLDRAIELAEEYGLRLILPLTNYWKDFGGVPQYLQWFGLTGEDQFYRNEDVIRTYRGYVEHLVTRRKTRTGRLYSDEPAILAWELMNEPRCVTRQGRATANEIDVLVGWIETMSTFVKSLDRNHLVGVGDEGYFRRSGAGRNNLYNGSHGVDCERIMGVPTVDFGTCHLYPSFDERADSTDFGMRWIREHIEAGQRANKPMLIEEYGYQTNGAGDTEGKIRRDRVFQAWLNQILESKGAGALVWMIASRTEDGELYPDYDHYTVYKAEDIPSIVAFSQTV